MRKCGVPETLNGPFLAPLGRACLELREPLLGALWTWLQQMHLGTPACLPSSSALTEDGGRLVLTASRASERPFSQLSTRQGQVHSLSPVATDAGQVLSRWGGEQAELPLWVGVVQRQAGRQIPGSGSTSKKRGGGGGCYLGWGGQEGPLSSAPDG